MRISVQRERGMMALGGMMLAAVLFSTGCEWTGTSNEDAWSDRMSWVNFSGVYRSGSDRRALVENFSLSSGNVGSGPVTEEADYAEYREPNQLGHVQASPFTTIIGTINYPNRGTAGWSLKPGSVNITLTGEFTAPVGSFTDNGQGGLAGTYAQVPGGPSFSATGRVSYETGAWDLTLSPDDPFIEPAQVAYAYVYRQQLGSGGDQSGTGTSPTSHDWVYTLRLEQLGNHLRFTDNRGFVWEGRITSVTTPGGDQRGNTSGEVMATFEATGVSHTGYTISGTFSGQYAASTEEGGGAGSMVRRRMQGIWMEPAGNGDLYGETGDITVAAQTQTSAPTP